MNPGDIVLVSGRGWLPRLIKWFTRSPGEAKTKTTHVALALSSTRVLESTWRGCRLVPHTRGKVWRAKNISPETLLRIANHGYHYIGKPYGYGKVVLHALDGLFGTTVFRKMGTNDQAPICSWVVAAPYAKEGYYFGLFPFPRCADPDDISDFITSHPHLYEQVD